MKARNRDKKEDEETNKKESGSAGKGKEPKNLKERKLEKEVKNPKKGRKPEKGKE